MTISEPYILGVKYKIQISERYTIQNLSSQTFKIDDIEYSFKDLYLEVSFINSTRNFHDLIQEVEQNVRNWEDYYRLIYGSNSIKFLLKEYVYDNKDSINKFGQAHIYVQSSVQVKGVAH